MQEQSSPFALYEAWLAQATHSGEEQPHVMSLATVNELGQPSVRMVALHLDNLQKGMLSFCTHMESRKAYDIFRNPHVSLCCYWKSTKQSIRIEGVAYTLTDEKVEEIFANYQTSRKLALWVSKPFSPLDSPNTLHEKLAHYAKLYGDQDIPKPGSWGGFCVQPQTFEFWEEDAFDLHKNQLFTLEPEGWKHQWLYP